MTAGEQDNCVSFTPASLACKEAVQGSCGIPIHELEILVFTLNGITFGVDTEQLGGVLTAAEAGAAGTELVPFSDKIPMSGMAGIVQTPYALLIKDTAQYAVVIESPEDIISIRIDAIRPLPPLMAACNTSQAVWGVGMREEGIILLVDFLGLHDADDY